MTNANSNRHFEVTKRGSSSHTCHYVSGLLSSHDSDLALAQDYSRQLKAYHMRHPWSTLHKPSCKLEAHGLALTAAEHYHGCY